MELVFIETKCTKEPRCAHVVPLCDNTFRQCGKTGSVKWEIQEKRYRESWTEVIYVYPTTETLLEGDITAIIENKTFWVCGWHEQTNTKPEWLKHIPADFFRAFYSKPNLDNNQS